MKMEFTRTELQELRDKAIADSDTAADNRWRQAYIQLAEAADRLDAMEARTEDR